MNWAWWLITAYLVFVPTLLATMRRRAQRKQAMLDWERYQGREIQRAREWDRRRELLQIPPELRTRPDGSMIYRPLTAHQMLCDRAAGERVVPLSIDRPELAWGGTPLHTPDRAEPVAWAGCAHRQMVAVYLEPHPDRPHVADLCPRCGHVAYKEWKP